jgi:high-affinity nickel-transport protein
VSVRGVEDRVKHGRAGAGRARRAAGAGRARGGARVRVASVARSLTPAERRSVGWMCATIGALHVVGFGVFLLAVLPSHARGLGLGIAGLAYSLGLRHAFDADHISAIDNTTRKLRSEGKRPLRVGYWFSLGHSTVVVVIALGVVVAERAVYGAVSHSSSPLAQFGGVFGTLVSAAFLYAIALLNIAILAGIARVFRSMRTGSYDEQELERQLENRGVMARILRSRVNAIREEWHMYPVGVLFGLGFDTATEVALLASTAVLASGHVPAYAIMCLPILFTAGMCLLDTIDGVFMNCAYSWACVDPVRKVYYNLALTGLSIAVCFVVATVELLGLLASKVPGLHGGLWQYFATFDINRAGLVIVGMFVLCTAGALAFWRFGRVEERWRAKLEQASG